MERGDISKLSYSRLAKYVYELRADEVIDGIFYKQELT